MLSWAERRSIAKGMGISYIERENTEQPRPSMQESIRSLHIPISEQMKNEEIESLKKLTDGDLSRWICDLYALQSKTEEMDKFERRQVRRQLKAVEAEWEQRKSDKESQALKMFTDAQIDEMVTHFHKLKEKVGEDKTVERQLRIAKKEQTIRRKKKELRDTIDAELNKENVSPKEKYQEVAGTADKRYINEHLNFIYPEVYQRTGITQNFRLYGSIQKIVMEKRQGSDKYTRKYNEDGGEGFADFMCILFPSSAGNLNINGGRLDRPHFKQDCAPTPKMCAQIAAFIYRYRKMNPQEKENVSKKMKDIIHRLGEKGINIHAKKDKEYKKQFSKAKEYMAYEESYEQVYTAWKNLCKVDERFAKIDGKSQNIKEQKKIFQEIKTDETGKKYLEFVCDLFSQIQLNGKKGNGDYRTTLENYKVVCNFFETKKAEEEIKVIKQIQSFFKDYMFESDFFAKGKKIPHLNHLKKANTILRLLYHATKAIDTQERDETNAPGNCIPQYTVEKMFMGYVLNGITEREKRNVFYETAERLIRTQMINEQAQGQSIGEKEEDGLSETKGILGKMEEKLKSFSPYQGDAVNYAEARAATKLKNDSSQIQFGATFSDCADTAMRHTLNLLGYSLKKNWDVFLKNMDESLMGELGEFKKVGDAEGGKFKHLPLKERVQLYFYYQSQEDVGPNEGGMRTRSLWAYVISNMKMLEDTNDESGLRRMYSITYAKGDYELKAGHLNSLKLIYNVARALKENQKGEIPKEDLDQFKSAEESIGNLQKLINENKVLYMESALRYAIQSVYQLINPNVQQQQIKIRELTLKGKDIFAEVDVNIPCGDNSSVDFTVKHQDGHAEVSHHAEVPKIEIEGEIKSEYAKLLVQKYKLQKKEQEFDSFHSLYSDFGKKAGKGSQFPQLCKKNRALHILRMDEIGQVAEDRADTLANPMIKGSEINVEFLDGKQSQGMDGYLLDHYANTANDLSCFLYDTNDSDTVTDMNVEKELKNYKDHHYHVDGNYVYAINEKDHTAAFVGCNTGRNNYPEHVNILPQIKVGEETYVVTEIRKRAFFECAASKLNKVTIPASVKKMEEEVFYGCSIQELHFADNSQLEEIGGKIFNSCCKIKKLILPASVKKIGQKLLGDSQIEEVNIAEGACLEEIGELAFANHTFKKALRLPNVKKIGKQAFKGAKFEELYLGEEQLEEISDYAFQEAHIMGELIIPKSVRKIEEGAFYYTDISKLGFAKGGCLETIGRCAFELANIKGEFMIPKTVKEIEQRAFCEAYFEKLGFEEGDCLEKIKNSAFEGATIKGNLRIPRSVKVIEKSAFWSCKGNDSIQLVEDGALEVIGEWAFARTTIKGDLVIPKNVKTIGAGAFSDCFQLGEIRFAAGALPANLAANAFGRRKVTV